MSYRHNLDLEKENRDRLEWEKNVQQAKFFRENIGEDWWQLFGKRDYGKYLIDETFPRDRPPNRKPRVPQKETGKSENEKMLDRIFSELTEEVWEGMPKDLSRQSNNW